MNQLYSYKMRLKPTKEQKILLNKHFGCIRYIYNHFLSKNIKEYKENKTKFSYKRNSAEIPKLKKELNWLKEVNSQSIQYATECFRDAYQSFFEKISGFPKFKKKNNKQSFRAKQQSYKCNEGICYTVRIENNKLIIPKFLEGIKIIKNKTKSNNKRIKQEIEGKIKFATINKTKTNKYF